MISGIDANFRRFAQRFVRHYWAEVAQGELDERSASTATERGLGASEEIAYETSCHHTHNDHELANICSLRMMNHNGDVWRFTFRRKNGTWILVTATSGSEQNETRVNLLDAEYEPAFRPFLERIVHKAGRND